MCVCVVNGRRACARLFGSGSVYDGRKRKAENDDGQHNSGTLEKVFHIFAPFKIVFKDVPALISSRRLRVLSGVSPQVSRGACCLSSTRRRWPLCVRLVLFCSALLFVFVIVFRHHHTSKTGFFLQMACPLLLLM